MLQGQVYRNLLTKWRKRLSTCLEILIPVLLVLALVGIKSTSVLEESDAKSFASQAILVPTIQDLAQLPSLVPVGGEWYLQYLSKFVSHGGSNVAFRCDTSSLDVGVEELGSLCSALKFVIIPADQGDVNQRSIAEAFKDDWIAKNPILEQQGRFNYSSSIVDNASLERYMEDPGYPGEIGLAIVFSSDLKYSIRVNNTASYANGPPKRNVPSSTASPTNDLERDTTEYTDQYVMSGFLTVQQDVDMFLLSRQMGGNMTLKTSLFAMPTAYFAVDPFWQQSSSTFGLFLMLAMLYPIAQVISQLVSDKETGIRELMFQMGLKPWKYSCSWIFLYVVFFAMEAVLLTLVSKINVFELTEWSVVFVYFLLFLYSSTAFGIFISSLFERTNLAVVVGLLIYFIGYFLYTPLSDATSPLGGQILVSLIPSAAFSFGTLALAEYEGGNIPMTWSTLSATTQSSYTLATCFGMLIFDTLFYLLLGAYFDAVLPSGSGKAREKWYNPLGLCRRNTMIHTDYESIEKSHDQLEAKQNPAYFEKVPESLLNLRKQGKGVMVTDLSKTYKRGGVQANSNITLTFYENQITCLLGQNGSGKSTMIKLLTGLTDVTSGQAHIDGLSVRNQMGPIRQRIGLCPQHSILFPFLTVKETLRIFASIKGVSRKDMDASVNEVLGEIGLTDQKNVACKNLSGGMQRRLSLGLALIGDSKVIIIDEATSGVDPTSRQAIQACIARHRQGRTIILTTHFMDEADFLGDRICIIANGRLRCAGSSLFLKKRFGVGYQLTIEDIGNQASVKRIQEIVAKHVNASKSTVGSELLFRLPLSSSAIFEDLLNDLNEAGVQASLSVTTLESVFLRISQLQSHEELDDVSLSKLQIDDDDNDQHQDDDDNNNEQGSGNELMLEDKEKEETKVPIKPPAMATPQRGNTKQQFTTLLHKRYLYAKRDRWAWCCQLLIPIAFLLIGFAVLKINPGTSADAYWFSSTTDGWNQELMLPNPIPYNLGEGMSVSPSLTTDWMNQVVLPRKEVQPFVDIGPTGPYCESEALFRRSVASSWEIVKFVIPEANDLNATFLLDLLVNASSPLLCDPATDVYPNSTATFSANLAETRNLSKGSRYGALLFDVVPFNSSGQVVSNETQYTIIYNFTARHAAPLMMNRANAALLNMLVPSLNQDLETSVHVFPRTQLEKDVSAGFNSFTATLCIAISFSFVPASWAIFLVREKERKSYAQQLITGVRPEIYWASNWVWDCTLYFLVPMPLTWILIAAFDVQVFTEEFGIVALVFILYGLAVTSFVYCWSFWINSYQRSQFLMLMVLLLGGLIMNTAAFIMFLLDNTYEVNNVLMYFYRLIPSFCLAHALTNVANLQILAIVLNTELRGGDLTNPKTYTVWSLEIAGLDLIYLGVESIVFALLLFYLQRRFHAGSCSPGQCLKTCCCCLCKSKKAVVTFKNENSTPQLALKDDPDVEAEKARILNGAEGDPIVFNKLRIAYPGKVAVQELTFGIRKAECFALLGINGAGKTSTIRCAVGIQRPTEGSVMIGGYDPASTQANFGYCSQFDEPLFDLLSGREILEFYGKLKGIPNFKEVAQEKIEQFDFVQHAEKLSSTYSGGNKRKLSVAIATLGKPAAVFLDEPSSGMDVKTRRKLIKAIHAISRETSVVLTTHSMEEAEAAASKIGIMAGGKLRCIGTAAHLKQIYGKGFQLEIRQKLPTEEDLAELYKTFGPECNEETTLQQEQVRSIIAGIREINLEDGSPASKLFKEQLDGKASISAEMVADYIYGQRRSLVIIDAISTHFSGTLIDHQGQRLRFSVPKQSSMSMASMFGIIENQKEDLHIETYSLGIVNLESIFNMFAQEQDLIDHPVQQSETSA